MVTILWPITFYCKYFRNCLVRIADLKTVPPFPVYPLGFFCKLKFQMRRIADYATVQSVRTPNEYQRKYRRQVCRVKIEWKCHSAIQAKLCARQIPAETPKV